MADRFAALAGYSGASAYDSTLDQSITTNLRDDPPGLETTEPSINLDLPKNRPSSANITQRRKPAPSTTTINHEKPYHSNDRSDRGAPQTPFAPRSENVQHDPLGAAPPSTQRKPDPRRRYGVRIAVDEDALDEPEDSLEASGGEAELRRMQADLSEGGVDSMIGSPPANDSGQWGSRAMRRRSAAGVSMKSAQERINSLVKERDELKIEVDLLRGKVSLDDRVAELIVLKKEKLSSTQKMIAQQGFIKQQDKAIKALQKEQHAWKGRDPVEVDRLLADLEEQVRSANARADEERRERIRAEEEVEFLKGRGAHTSSTSRGRNEETLDEGGGEVARLKSEIEALQEDHANEKYELRRERDALQDELDAARDEIDELKDRSIHPGRSQRGDDNSLNRREIDELEQRDVSTPSPLT
ncbi:hypothetical protein IE53DRAFT_187931 [Violaceomyces palustris]|uniref:Uncharacterized protein n=1 Tax=Violaceomyces palustris TaxID=1673888 RepID=A0ACD0NRZ4_9BASI|nr:hypothetical protein IE53DRAFT_187931 [Violaceomyces palustris]